MDRPDPDAILAKVNSQESKRGKLKIFFGAVAGVGKTYAMLEAARLRKKEGIDVVAGYIEAHKRPETQNLLEGLETIPLRHITYKNVDLNDFDIDAALKRNPKLILVDELAHTNAPGARHPKRWQDIEELLDNGIDVYTTLNVQHCESANDIVAQITGVRVRETIPDTLIENAYEIELVDLPSEELLKRLKEGKVYLGEQAARAAENFFQPGNLLALRQLALRYTERSVDVKLLSYKRAHAVSTVWNARDKFLVSISPSPSSVSLVRAGKRIASDLGAEWTAVYVDNFSQLIEKDKKRLADTMFLAEKLGAKVVTLSGYDVAETLIAYARAENISKIIMGKPGKPRWRERIFGSIVDHIARRCGEIDLYLLSGDIAQAEDKPGAVPLPPVNWKDGILTIGVVIACTLLNLCLVSYFAPVNLVMIYLLGVAWTAFRYGRRLSILASFLSVLFFDFFLIPPYLTFVVDDTQYLFTFAVMFTVGMLIADITGKLRRQNFTIRLREQRTQRLYSLSSALAKSSYPQELFKIAAGHTEDFFKCPVAIFVALDSKVALLTQELKNEYITENEAAVAQWAYEHKKPAGNGTDTLPGARGVYLPFIGAEKVVGVMGLFPAGEKQFIDPEQKHLLELFVAQTALAVEGAQLAVAADDALTKIENERLKNLILTTFSMELPVPLAAVSSIAQELLKTENITDEALRTELVKQMNGEIERLNLLLRELPKLI